MAFGEYWDSCDYSDGVGGAFFFFPLQRHFHAATLQRVCFFSKSDAIDDELIKGKTRMCAHSHAHTHTYRHIHTHTRKMCIQVLNYNQDNHRCGFGVV